MKRIKWKIIAGVAVTVLLWWAFMSFVTHLGLSGHWLSLAATASLGFILRIAVAVGEDIARNTARDEAAGDVRAWSEERRAAGLETVARGRS